MTECAGLCGGLTSLSDGTGNRALFGEKMGTLSAIDSFPQFALDGEPRHAIIT